LRPAHGGQQGGPERVEQVVLLEIGAQGLDLG
jgi:hypothetical protein